MLTVVATLKVKEGSAAEFEKACQAMIKHVEANEPGTKTYLLHRSMGDATEYLFYEVYEDQAALDAHSKSEAMMAFFGAVGGLLAGRPEIKLYQAC